MRILILLLFFGELNRSISTISKGEQKNHNKTFFLKQIVSVFAAGSLLRPTLTGGIVVTAIAIAPDIVAHQPAAAAWWDNVDGVYMNIYGSQYYYGTYLSNPNPKFQGST